MSFKSLFTDDVRDILFFKILFTGEVRETLFLKSLFTDDARGTLFLKSLFTDRSDPFPSRKVSLPKNRRAVRRHEFFKFLCRKRSRQSGIPFQTAAKLHHHATADLKPFDSL